MNHSGPGRARSSLRHSVVLWLCAALACGDAVAEVLRSASPALELGVDTATGGIVAFVDTASRQDFSNPAAVGSVWELEFAGSSKPSTLASTNAGAFRVHPLAGLEPGLRLVWSRFGLADAPELCVEVTVRLDSKQALSRWQLGVEALGPRALERIRFPRILNVPQLERERLVVPFWAGLLSSNPRQLFGPASTGGMRREYDYPGICSMQCLAFYSEGGPGLYVATDDTAGYRKLFAVFGPEAKGTNAEPGSSSTVNAATGNRLSPDLNFEVIHLPDRQETAAERYMLPYSAVLGSFRGDWFDAALIYRSWATNQIWARESRWKRGVVPSWVADTGLWIWNRGRSENVLEPAVAMHGELGLPVSVLWHWWHGCAYDTGFPEYFPPREGEASFTAALRQGHEQEVRALVYMNQRLWGMTTASWTNEHAAAFAVKAADGEVKPEHYNTFSKLPCATMCLGTHFWRAKYSSLAIHAFHGLGVDGIYMDQACSSLACFDPQHGHPPGGGTYWVNGFKTLMTGIREQCASRGGVALAGEGCAENWLPWLDLMLALDVSRERYCAPDGWEPIPFFQAVYHGYGAFFGSYSSLTSPPYDELWPAEFAPKQPLALLDRQFRGQFYLEQARAFVWGQQPGLANFRPSQFGERPVEIGYVMHLARLRQRAVKYLQDGVMLPPPRIEVPSDELPFSRLSIYAGQRSGVTAFPKTVPLVLASAWQGADGTAAVAVASIAERPLRARVLLEGIESALPRPGRFRAIGQDSSVPITGGDGEPPAFELELGPLEAHVLEWKPGR